MLLFQLAYTGVGGLLIWPHWAWFNDAAPPAFMLIMVGSGIWFIREATSLSRHGARIDRFVLAFSAFGPVFAPVYLLLSGPAVYSLLQLYALASVVISITLCLWTWRRGERYSWWLFLGFLPVHLGYPFPALRAAGLLPDSWATQYAVLIGSALEIPLLLYILNYRAKDFSENRARLRAIDSTDPLTGLPIIPVLRLRVRDALRRARRAQHRCVVMMVELANHADIVHTEGREAGDRALVVAASRLSGVVREVDTVCRVADARYAVLLEGPQTDQARRATAQHIVARGLEPVSQLPQHLTLKFRIVSAWVPDPEATDTSPAGGQAEELKLLETLDEMLNRLLDDDRKVVLHLEGLRPPVQSSLPAEERVPG
jgi:diguanylate cyclase (GGDEF)-like protein